MVVLYTFRLFPNFLNLVEIVVPDIWSRPDFAFSTFSLSFASEHPATRPTIFSKFIRHTGSKNGVAKRYHIIFHNCSAKTPYLFVYKPHRSNCYKVAKNENVQKCGI